MQNKHFGIDKCKKIHIGKTHEEYKCQLIHVDKWTEHEEENKKTGIIEIKDAFEGEEVMGDSNSEKYLGDIISKDSRNIILNIKARLSKGKGIIKKILNILNCIPFGKLFYQIKISLRNSLLVSSVLCNSEAWFNLTNSYLKMIETIDIEFLRNKSQFFSVKLHHFPSFFELSLSAKFFVCSMCPSGG